MFPKSIYLKLLLMVFFSLLLVSCTQQQSPSDESIDFNSLVFQEGDLPAGYSLAQTREKGLASIWVEKEVERKYSRQFNLNGEDGGMLSIYIFPTEEIAHEMYMQIIETDFYSAHPIYQPVINLGDESLGGFIGTVLDESMVIFRNCKAIVYVKFASSRDYTGLIEYSRKIDSRLSQFSCD